MAERTSLKTRRVEPGKYRTVDGRWQVERDGKEWVLYSLTEGQEPRELGRFRTSDAALISVLEQPDPPARPKRGRKVA
jgi:hypothetical protein